MNASGFGCAEFQASPSAARALKKTATNKDALPAVDVRHVPGNEHEKHLWRVLRQADVPELDRRARALVDLPADRDLLHLQADEKNEIARQIAPETRASEGGVGVMRARRDAGAVIEAGGHAEPGARVTGRPPRGAVMGTPCQLTQ